MSNKFLIWSRYLECFRDAVSGSTFDWVKGETNVPIVYLFELRDIGEYGFLIPPEFNILPNNEEIMDGLI